MTYFLMIPRRNNNMPDDFGDFAILIFGFCGDENLENLLYTMHTNAKFVC
jgi:hypothetical protein